MARDNTGRHFLHVQTLLIASVQEEEGHDHIILCYNLK